MSTQYLTWEAFLAGTTHSYRLEWCRGKADQASRPRLKTPIVAKVTAVQVLDVLMAARGRCCCCGSLAVSKLPRPGLPRGEAADRRVGSLEHTIALIDGGMKRPGQPRLVVPVVQRQPPRPDRSDPAHLGGLPPVGPVGR
ncbi:MAG: hypothetical protein JWR58_1856 [Pseudonocardia sp.]|nr:hypothetical protein [Pseudonocardia sp.]